MGKPENQRNTEQSAAAWSIDETLETLKAVEKAIKEAHPDNALTPRERLMQRVLEISDYEVGAVLDYIDQLEDLADIAVSQSRKDEVGAPLDDVLKRHGFTREELTAESETEDMPQ